MKITGNKAVVVVLTAAVLMSAFLPTGCSHNAKDKEEIKTVTQDFIDAFAEGPGEVEDLIDGDAGFLSDDSEENEVIMKLASATEIKQFTEIEVDRRELKAKARMKIKYIDISEFCRAQGRGFLTKDDYLHRIDSYSDLETENLTLNFVFDEDEGRWLIKQSSAEKYFEIFDRPYLLNIVSSSADDADDIFNEVYEHLAQGEFDLSYYSFDINEMRIFDERESDDPAVVEAAAEFAKAYFKYIVDHGILIETDYGDFCSATLKGFAPSKEEILGYISSDEHIIEMYMTNIRMASSVNRDIQPVHVRNAIAVEVYLDLAKRIPDMESERYTVELSFDASKGDNTALTIGGYDSAILPITEDEVYIANTVSTEQEFRCRQKALDSLLDAGEIPQAKYDAYEAALDRDWSIRNGQTPLPYTRNVEWEGTEEHENQAVRVTEELPEWSDGQLIYGNSEEDENGVFMFYSKEPGWLDTAGYNIGDDGITVMLRYDHEFTKDTELLLDWYIDGEAYKDTIEVVVKEDGTAEFEFTLVNTEIPKYGTVELRLWEADHSHVIAYIKLTQS